MSEINDLEPKSTIISMKIEFNDSNDYNEQKCCIKKRELLILLPTIIIIHHKRFKSFSSEKWLSQFSFQLSTSSFMFRDMKTKAKYCFKFKVNRTGNKGFDIWSLGRKKSEHFVRALWKLSEVVTISLIWQWNWIRWKTKKSKKKLEKKIDHNKVLDGKRRKISTKFDCFEIFPLLLFHSFFLSLEANVFECDSFRFCSCGKLFIVNFICSTIAEFIVELENNRFDSNSVHSMKLLRLEKQKRIHLFGNDGLLRVVLCSF